MTATLMRSLGIDLSTTATGMVALQDSGTPKPFCVLECEYVPPKGLKGMDRHRAIVLNVMETIHVQKPDKIVVEGYSLHMGHPSSVVPLVELGGLLRFFLHLDELKWYDPRATELKKFATGKGTAPKDMVMMNVLKRWGHESKTNNTADAYVLAAMGLASANALPEITVDMRAIAGKMQLKAV